MTIYTSEQYGTRVDVIRDYDDEIMLAFHTVRGVVKVEIPEATEAMIETPWSDDPEDLQDACESAISDAFSDLIQCFEGTTFSHFADAPNDNSELVTRQRTAQEIREARNCIAYRDLVEGGLTEKEIHAIISTNAASA